VSLRLRDGRELPAQPVADALALIGAVVSGPLGRAAAGTNPH
jgi:hypothetical protein